ncbi:DUF11 domain-containing protein [Loktanella sp. S4079]|uniref:DUF11 domain-containing protein n=1 Tax=Loktanella sp. S4079 TaxID=579483 RepID=UPI0005FA4C7E|nr:DUF11 domain-containing protein [Loktanella sp. S4079]KJZ20227.1 hypothetical protein TW80_05195 [Loktanella sp. S4079]
MKQQRKILLSSSALVAATLVGSAAFAAPPDAGTVIGNQAVATYTNAAGDTITVTSNKVETVVQQVAGVTITSDNTENIAPGGKAFLPHIITNDGNGPDAFTLTATEGAGGYDFDSVTFYADADMDGVADNATPITQTPTLAAGERFGVVIDATAPSTATAGQSETLTVAAASILTAAVTSSNVDTLTVSSAAIMELVKSMVVDKSAGDPSIVDAGDTVTITLTYTNTGLAASTAYSVEDIIDANLPFTSGSAQWSDRAVAGGLDETNGTGVDATNGSGETIVFEVNTATNTIDFTISNVDPGRTGSVTFETTIGALADAGLIENTATQSDVNGAFPPSNTASVEVDPQYAHVMDDTYTQADTTVVRSLTDDGAAGDDEVTETGDVSQGGVIAFEFVIGNDSNKTDSYTLDFANTDFPAGTSFRFVGADGVTPIVGSVGPLAPGEATKVTLLATLPSNTAPTAAGATNFTATVDAISEASGQVNSSTAEFTGAVQAASVDLENSVVGSEGDGAAPTNGGNPWVTTNTDPGVAVSFPMSIENLGPTSDSYNLSLAAPLPAGWSYEFQLADGTVVTNTGTIPSGSTADIVVVVTPEDGAAPQDVPFEVVVSSPVSGQSDSIVNQVTVNEVVDVAIVASQTVQAAPGGVVDIRHTITNEGNITITEGAITQTGLTDFSGAIYWDQNADGVLDPSDPVIDNIDDIGGLAAGATAALIYRVQAGSVPGSSEIGTLALATSLNSASVTDGDTADNAVEDRIVVVSGDVTLVKTQAIDPTCTGAVGAFSKDRQDVEPGQCIRYRVEASNTGTAPVANVEIKDIVPAYTTFENCGGGCDAAVTPVATSTVTTATAPNISSTHGTVEPGSFATLEFTVKVDE